MQKKILLFSEDVKYNKKHFVLHFFCLFLFSSKHAMLIKELRNTYFKELPSYFMIFPGELLFYLCSFDKLSSEQRHFICAISPFFLSKHFIDYNKSAQGFPKKLIPKLSDAESLSEPFNFLFPDERDELPYRKVFSDLIDFLLGNKIHGFDEKEVIFTREDKILLVSNNPFFSEADKIIKDSWYLYISPERLSLYEFLNPNKKEKTTMEIKPTLTHEKKIEIDITDTKLEKKFFIIVTKTNYISNIFYKM